MENIVVTSQELMSVSIWVIGILGSLIVLIAGWLGFFVKKSWVAMACSVEGINKTLHGDHKTAGLMQIFKEMQTDITEIKADITEVRKETELNGGERLKDLSKSAAIDSIMLRGQLHRSMDLDTTKAYFEANAKGECTWVSSTYLRWLGATMDEVKENGWIGFIDQEKRDDVREEWAYAVIKKMSIQSEFIMRNSQRTKRFGVMSSAKAIKDNSGRLVGFIGEMELVGDFYTETTQEA